MPSSSEVLVIGLGNPGAEYERTRHNFGIRVLKDWCEGEWRHESEWPAEVCHMMQGEQAVTAFFPLTFMNDSGRAVAAYLDYHPYAVSQIIIVHDDLEIPFGEMQWQTSGSAHGHKGVRSIHQALQTTELTRLRLGIGRPTADMPVDAYVLQAFSSAEETAVPALLTRAQHELAQHIEARPRPLHNSTDEPRT